ncbi:hypothetical protein [Sorangium sp. So ce176]|uniref:hypothetical protein n=1 Tax=Sorangium sp. So ce176 TaxID=3133286 RepID=UPI003F63817E
MPDALDRLTTFLAVGRCKSFTAAAAAAAAAAALDVTPTAVLEAFLTKGPGFYLYFPARTQEQPELRALTESVTSSRGQKAKRRSGRTGVSGGGVPA